MTTKQASGAAIVSIAGRGLPIRGNDIDTDRIMPARYLKVTDKKGLGEVVFYDWRYNEDGSPKSDFLLNQPHAQNATILVAGHNFGCGSSREHAPWALQGYGFQAIISTQFADIFRNNSLKNGLLPIVVDHETHEQLLDLAELPGTPAQLTIQIADAPVRYVHGQVRQVELVGRVGGRWRYRVQVVPKLELLCQIRKSRIFQEQAVPDIVQDVIAEARKLKPRWGPIKLRSWLTDRYPGVSFPSPSAVAAILKRRGLVRPAKRRRAAGTSRCATRRACACWRRSTRWCGTVAASRPSGAGRIASRPMCRRRSASAATTRCRCCGATVSSDGRTSRSGTAGWRPRSDTSRAQRREAALSHASGVRAVLPDAPRPPALDGRA